MADIDEDALLADLGADTAPAKLGSKTPLEERIIAGFEDIVRFRQSHGRAPLHGEGRDIFERLYAARLDQIRKLAQAPLLLASLDAHGLLSSSALASTTDAIDDDALLAELSDAPLEQNDIRVLRHVRSATEKRAAEAIADRKPCADFDAFAALLGEVGAGLKSGLWTAKVFGKDANIEPGDFFIVGGQIAYVAESTPGQTTSDGRDNPRLRVVFDNRTESNLLMRSLRRALYADGDAPVGRRLIKRDDGPLFGQTQESDDIAVGTIYVLRSQSKHPFVAAHRELIHKIGVTGGKVETRIANAAKDATYLLADVEIIATYQLHNLNRTRLEGVFHKLFGAAQLDLAIEDRFGQMVKPREWFLVPLHVIDEAVQRIRDGSIVDASYDVQSARLLP